MKRAHVEALLLACAVVYSLPAGAAAGAARDDARARLRAATGNAVSFSDHRATGASRYVRVEPAARARLGNGPAKTATERANQSAAFFREYGAAIGVDDPTAMRLEASKTDRHGETHLTYKQFHGEVPVFAGVVKTHFDAKGLRAVTGTAVPDVTVNEHPIWSDTDAGQVAFDAIRAEVGANDLLGVGSTKLFVFREGLLMGVPGPTRLTWEVEVTDGFGIRELVYVDAHSGKIVDRITGIQDQLHRRAYDGKELAFVPSNYPNGIYWEEGERYPTLSTEANNMIEGSKETYDFFANAFGRDSFDGDGLFMDAIFDRGYSCPNASWNGTFISFCPGITTDDVTGHEWGHAYTQYTHGLIYQWQSGALNESYSDIWGETVDRINSRGTDAPAPHRSADACSTFSPPVGRLVVNSPDTIGGTYFAQSALFGPVLNATGKTADVVAALDEETADGPSTFDACTAITNAADVNGKIALVNRGTCNFSAKVYNAQQAGAIGVLIANNVPTGLPGMGPGLNAELVTIPSLGVQLATGAAIRDALVGGAVNATMAAVPGTDESVAWLMGEDTTPPSGDGALRDMWNPTCYGNPGKVSDTAYYECSTSDNGGVHINSGIPNHAFALLVDGGSYNGHTVAAIGLTKAAHVYFRAAEAYQTFDTDFAHHAVALRDSCATLLGQPLNALTGGPSNEVITSADCAAVNEAIAAVELEASPVCTFPTLLDTRTAPLCSAAVTDGTVLGIQSFGFESGDDGFVATRFLADGGSTRDWTRTSELPSPNAGSGFFADGRYVEGSCTDGSDQTGLLRLTSPEITLPAGTNFARATFEHWVATEAGWDGGNLSVSVNGGAFQLVPFGAFTFNPYNVLLFTAEQGNTNPLAGQVSFSGNDQGTVNGGSWGRTHVNLAAFARAGDRVRLRWNFGTDSCSGATGWYVDNVQVFSCNPNVPNITVADVSFPEGDADRTQRSVEVRLSVPTIRNVVVAYEIVDGTAHDGNDFETIGSGQVVIPGASATSASIGVQIPFFIKGDIAAEKDETFTVVLRSASGGIIADGSATVTIQNDDARPRTASR
jgi:Zn-dependent metalloprotease